MNKKEVIKKIRNMLVNIFSDDSIYIDDLTTTKDIDGWDSITKMIFISEIEEQFNTKLSTKDILSINKFSDFADLLLEKINRDNSSK